MTSLTARLAAAALTIPLVVATASTASAGTKSSFRSSGSLAWTSWVEVGELPGVAGNYHVGFLEARGDQLVDVFGDVTDWQCDAGELPPGGGGHGEEPSESGCENLGTRFIHSDPTQVTLTVDRRLASARLIGSLVVANHEGETQGQPPVDITWTGFGVTARTTSTFAYTDDSGVRFTFRSTDTTRQGDVEGRIGAMVFDDETGESSQGAFGSYRLADKGSTP